MRKLLISIMMIAGIAFAGENSVRVVAEGVKSGTTVTNTTTHLFTGQLESIYVDVTAPATNTVTISGKEGQLFQATMTADTIYRPRYAVVDSSGATVGSVTNQATKHLLVGEPLTVVVSGTFTNAIDCAVTIKTR